MSRDIENYEAVIRLSVPRGVRLSDDEPGWEARFTDALDDSNWDDDLRVVSVRHVSSELDLDPIQAEESLGLEDVPESERWDKDGAL